MKSSIPIGNGGTGNGADHVDTNGHANGKTNGHSNGYTNGNGHVAAETNGKVYTNGNGVAHTNGHNNSETTGISKTNGYNPVTGEGYMKPATAEINTHVPALNNDSSRDHVINKNRIPPGGFSSGLW